MSITKNENGTLSIGDIQIISSYNKETKQHTFNLLKNGCVPVQHIGNHLTLRNNIAKLMEQVEATYVEEVASEVASESFSETILDVTEFVQIPVDENAPTSESEDYNLFKDYLKKFSEATGEERENFAEIASQILLGMNIQAV
jgi:hypothetical protein